jgi:hypothetical protein
MSNIDIGDASYWDIRYSSELDKTIFQLFDWYVPFADAYPYFEGVIDTNIKHKVLVIGCGRSDTVEVLYNKVDFYYYLINQVYITKPNGISNLWHCRVSETSLQLTSPPP